MCELITLENGATAFVCRGHTKDHKCNEDLVVFLLADGRRVPDTEENRKKYWGDVRGGSVACSICGHAAIDDAPYLEI